MSEELAELELTQELLLHALEASRLRMARAGMHGEVSGRGWR